MDRMFEYHRCRRCGTVFLRDRIGQQWLGIAYPENYHPYSGSQSTATEVAPSTCGAIPGRLKGWLAQMVLSPSGLVRARFVERVDRWWVPSQSQTTVLDFGCGAGKHLDQAKRAGHATVGMDFSPHALEAARSRGHLAVEVSEQGWASLPDESIDFVRMNHVLEHLYRPRDVLTRLRQKMRPGGRLHVAVPNPNSLSARLFRGYWHGLDCPRHVALYPPHVVRSLLSEAGLRVIDVIHEPVTKDHIRSWVYLLRESGFLSEVNPDIYMKKVVLRFLAALPMALAVVFRAGDRFHVLAQR